MITIGVQETAKTLVTGDVQPNVANKSPIYQRQVEGAWNEDGRKPSIWDKFTHDGRAFKAKTASLRVGRIMFENDCMWLMGWNMFYFSILFSIHWESSAELTNMFQRGCNHQPGIIIIIIKLSGIAKSENGKRKHYFPYLIIIIK